MMEQYYSTNLVEHRISNMLYITRPQSNDTVAGIRAHVQELWKGVES